jgi:hypothetical protein
MDRIGTFQLQSHKVDRKPLAFLWIRGAKLTIPKAGKDKTRVTKDDASSERKLTTEQTDDSIHVQREWEVSRA